MMDSWRRELRGVQSGPEWEVGGRGGPREELDLTKMDTLIMQVSKMSRSVAEVRESCLCLEESISMEEQEQTIFESELKSSTINPSRGHQHSVTETNLQTSAQLIRAHIEESDKENEMLEEELRILIKRLMNMKESKRIKLREMKDQYGNQLVDKEEVEQEKKVVGLKHKKNVLATSILSLKWEKQRKAQEEWHNFEEVVINMATLQHMVRNKCKTLQQYKDSVQMLQTEVHSKKQVESPAIIWRKHEDSKRADTHNLSFVSHVAQHDLTLPKASSTTFVPTVQGQDHTQARYSFTTSLSLLKLPSTKFGHMKTNNCPWNIQKNNEMTLDSSVSEDYLQKLNPVSCSQAQPLETSPHCFFKNHSQITANSEPNSSPLLYQHSSNQNKHQRCNQAPGPKTVSPSQGSTTSSIDSISFSPKNFSPAHTQTFDAPSLKDMGCSTFMSQATRGQTSSHEISSIAPQAYKGLEMAPQKSKSVRSPLGKPKSAEMTISRGFQSPHISNHSSKFRGAGNPCLLSRNSHVPPLSKGIGKSPSRHLSIYSQVPYQKHCKKYNNPALVSTEVSGFSLPAEHVTYKEKSQEFLASTDCPEEKSAASFGNNENGPSSNTVPSAPNETASSILPIPIEVDNHESLKVTSPVPSTCSTLLMEPSNTEGTSQFSEGSQQSINTTLSIAEKSMDCSPVASYTSPVTISISSSSYSSHSISKKQKKSEAPGMKFLQYKQIPSTPNSNLHQSSQGFHSSTPAPSSSFPFIFQDGLQANSEGNLRFNLFESSLAESSLQESSRNSGSSIFALDDFANSRTDSTSTGLFNLNLGSDGESTEHSDSSFFSSLFDSSSDTNSNSNETSSFHLF